MMPRLAFYTMLFGIWSLIWLASSLCKKHMNFARIPICMGANEREEAILDLRKLGMSEKAAEGLYSMGIRSAEELRGKDPVELYERLRNTPGQYCEPCMLSQFKIAVKMAEKRK
jgi:hypothetical protein